LNGRHIKTWLRCLGVLVLVAITTVPPRAQIASASDLRVTVMVARSCTVSTVAPTAAGSPPDSLISIRCAEGATPAEPQVSLVESAPAPVEQDVDAAGSLPAEDTRFTRVVVNF
jgi:hypothetical protein